MNLCEEYYKKVRNYHVMTEESHAHPLVRADHLLKFINMRGVLCWHRPL